jgi:hypothetical protein
MQLAQWVVAIELVTMAMQINAIRNKLRGRHATRVLD